MPEISVTVRLFASLREAVGRERVALRLPEGSTAAAAWPGLGDVGPMPSGTRYALNGDWAGADAALSDGDEIALILPVSGG